MRTKFSGNISVSGDDFTALIALEGSQLQYCVVIHRQCAGVWSELWKGYFSYFDYKVDLDRCQLSFEPSPFDIYTPVYDQMDIERNVLVADPGWAVTMDGFSFPSEEVSYSEITNNYTVFPLPLSSLFVEYTHDPVNYPPGNCYYFYSYYSIIVAHHQYYDDHLNTYTYKRDYSFTNSNLPGGEPPGTNWVLDPLLPGPGEYSPGIYKWVRPIGNSVSTNYVFGPNFNPRTLTLQLPNTLPIILLGCLPLKAILEYFATFFELTYVSDFFNNDPCPMGGNTLIETMLMQISNMKAELGWDTATKGMMKLKDLLAWIRDTFNVYWYIDSLGNFRLEHRKYFDQGLSYTAYAPVIELDLNLYPENIKHLNKYEWSKPSLVRYEKLVIQYSNFTDWVNAGIEYTQLSILGNAEKSINVEWGTDLISMYEDRVDLPDNGWVLLNTYRPAGWVDHTKVVNETGAITGASFQNARFSTANLMRDLWTWGRLLPTGNVNGVLTTFGSYQKLRKQVELTIPQCCQDLDYNGLFHTDLGNGLIDNAEYDGKTGDLKVNLKYE